MLQSLFPSPRDEAKEPHAVWLQPGAESDEIEAFIKEHGLADKIVLGGPCVLLHGDEARKLAGKL
jgi:predicted CoA-binding protein